MAQGIVKVGMEPLQDRPDPLVQDFALGLLSEVFHDLAILLGEFQVAG